VIFIDPTDVDLMQRLMALLRTRKDQLAATSAQVLTELLVFDIHILNWINLHDFELAISRNALWSSAINIPHVSQ